MTKVEILKEVKEKKVELLSEAKSKYYKVKKERDDKYFKAIEEWFGGSNLSFSDAYIKKPEYGGTTFEIVRPKEGKTYDYEVLTIRLRENWREGGFDAIEPSVYSTSEKSNWNLERLIIVGEVSHIILDYGDDIIAELNAIKDKYQKKYKDALDAVNGIKNGISTIESEINNSYLNKAETLLNTTGLKFDGDKKATMDLRWDWTLRGITSAKIIKKTASGKSADIEISCWNETPRVYEKVRMSNIEALEWQYRDYVIIK